MTVQAELSLYPLRSPDLSGIIEAFIDGLRTHTLEVRPGAMSTTVVGE